MKKLIVITALLFATGANAQVDISSLVPIARQFNSQCNLGIDQTTISKLAVMAEQFRGTGQLSDEQITQGKDIALQKYQQDPQGFCVEAQKAAVVIKQMFAGQ